MNIETTYNDNGSHESTATSGGYWCTCLGLSQCGEAFFEDNFDQLITDDDKEDMRDAAYREVKRKWDYDGSNWSEPVDEPDDALVGDPDDDHQVAIVKTAFHGGGIRGYATSQECADAWIEYFNAGGGCKCGCFGTCVASEVENLPCASDTHDPYTIAR